MDLIRLLQGLAAAIPPATLMAALLLAAAAATTIFGLLRARTELRRHAAAVGFLVVSALLLLTAPRGSLPAGTGAAAAMVALVLLVVYVARVREEAAEPAPPAPPIRPETQIWYLAVAGALAVLFLFADLSHYAATNLVWESGIARGFEAALRTGQPVFDYARQRLLWDHGLVSSGHASLLYGAGTYALWKQVGISIFTLRLVAALLALASLPAVWLAARQVGGRTVATVAVMVLAVSPVLIFYGRYGTSLSGTLLTTLLAFAVCCRLTRPTGVPWWFGLVAGISLYVATLGYSTARPVVVALLAVTLLLAVIGWRRLDRRRAVSLALLIGVVAAVWLVQSRYRTTDLFIAARGEQILKIYEYPGGIRRFLGRDVSPRDLSWRDRAEIAGNILRTTVPEFIETSMLPYSDRVSAETLLWVDPPLLPLYQGALLPFAVWGLALTVRRFRRPPQLLLLATMAAATVPALLTTRVDSHRLMMAVVPLVLLTAVGVRDAIRVSESCRVPAAVRHLIGALFLVVVASSNSAFLYYDPPPRWPLVPAVLDEVEKIAGPLMVIADLDDRWVGQMHIAVMDRRRRDPERSCRFLDHQLVLELGDEKGPTARALEAVRYAVARGFQVIVCPADRFDHAAYRLQQGGYWVRKQHRTGASFWYVTRRGSELASGEPPPPVLADPSL